MGALQLSSEDPEGNWTVFQNVFHSSTFDTLGHKSRKHQVWFDENDEEIQNLIDDKYRLHRAHQDVLAQYPPRQTTTAFLCTQ